MSHLKRMHAAKLYVLTSESEGESQLCVLPTKDGVTQTNTQ
jgi:hypothetical protein